MIDLCGRRAPAAPMRFFVLRLLLLTALAALLLGACAVPCAAASAASTAPSGGWVGLLATLPTVGVHSTPRAGAVRAAACGSRGGGERPRPALLLPEPFSRIASGGHPSWIPFRLPTLLLCTIGAALSPAPVFRARSALHYRLLFSLLTVPGAYGAQLLRTVDQTCAATPIQTLQIFGSSSYVAMEFKAGVTDVRIDSVSMCLGVSSGTALSSFTVALRTTSTISPFLPTSTVVAGTSTGTSTVSVSSIYGLKILTLNTPITVPMGATRYALVISGTGTSIKWGPTTSYQGSGSFTWVWPVLRAATPCVDPCNFRYASSTWAASSFGYGFSLDGVAVVPTATASATGSATATTTGSATAPASSTGTRSGSPSGTLSDMPSSTRSGSPTATPSGSSTPSGTGSPTGTPSPSRSGTRSGDPTSGTPTFTDTPTPSVSSTQSRSGTMSGTVSRTVTAVPAPCPGGTYLSGTNCTTCPGGTVSAAVGATSAATCTPCYAGYFCPPGCSAAPFGLPCGAGNYCPAGSAAPLPCPAFGMVEASRGPTNGPAFDVDTAACYNHCFFGGNGQMSAC